MIDAENASVIGETGSYIDGVNCYDEQGDEGFRGPHAICAWGCKNIRLLRKYPWIMWNLIIFQGYILITIQAEKS